MSTNMQQQQPVDKIGWRKNTNGNEDAEEALLKIHLNALDDLVNVNSLYTIAVFVGLSYAHAGQLSGLENRPECNADSVTAKRLVVYEVLSFSLFLLSSLAAKTLKVHFHINRNKYFGEDSTKDWCHSIFYRRVNLLLPACGSILGCVFLTLSMVDVIQIRVGKLSCGSKYTVLAAAPLVTIVGIALLIYTCTMVVAITKPNDGLLKDMGFEYYGKNQDNASTKDSKGP